MHRLILKAINVLPTEQRDTVRLHYYDGLRLSEIAILFGSPLGTIKARLHHARRRLKDSLPPQLMRSPTPSDEGGFSMIEVTVEDVVLRVPKNEEAQWLASRKDYKLGFHRVILLKELSGRRILPIWVGPVEGDFIALAIANLTFGRPTTCDLTRRLAWG